METVACELKYSGAGMAILLAATIATLALVLVLPLPDLGRASLLLYVAASAVRACRALLAPRWLRLDASRGIELREDRGVRSGQVRDGCFVMPWLTVVRWRPEGDHRDRTLLLLPGMATGEELRKIRVILRWA